MSACGRARSPSAAIRQVCSIRKISAGGAVLHVDQPVDAGRAARARADDRRAARRHRRLAARRRGRPALRRADRRVRGDRPGHRQPARRAPPHAARRAGLRRRCSRRRRAPNWSPPATSRRAAPRSTCRSRSTPEERVLITLDGLPPIQGVVRWSRGSCRRHRLPARAALAGADALAEGAAQAGARRARSAAPGRVRSRRRRRPSPSGEDGRPAQPAGAGARGHAALVDRRRLDHHPHASPSTASPRSGMGSLLWIVLPGLEGWPARIVSVEGYRFTCEFTQPLHPGRARAHPRARQGAATADSALVGLAARGWRRAGPRPRPPSRCRSRRR